MGEIRLDAYELKLIERLNAESMNMSYNDGPAKGLIRELYKSVDKKAVDIKPKDEKCHHCGGCGVINQHNEYWTCTTCNGGGKKLQEEKE